MKAAFPPTFGHKTAANEMIIEAARPPLITDSWIENGHSFEQLWGCGGIFAAWLQFSTGGVFRKPQDSIAKRCWFELGMISEGKFRGEAFRFLFA